MIPTHVNCPLLLCLTIAASVAYGQHRSDIFLKNWNPTGAEKFRVDGVTSLVPPSLVDREAIEAFETTVAEANGNHRTVLGRIPLDYRIEIYEEYARRQGVNLEDHICRSIEGDLISHPNGNIFLCSNSPFIRAAMKQMVDICSEAGCDWISADLQTATHDSLQGIKRDGRWSRISPPVEDLYTFIREHRELFDGYESWGSVGLVYSHLGHRHRAVVSENAVAHLVRNNVPFRLCIAGSDWWEPEFRLSGLDALVKTSDYQYLTAAQESAVRKSGQAVVDISSLDQLWEHLDRPIQVSIGNDRINVVVRRNQRKRLLHLVNMQPGTEHRDLKAILSVQFAGPVESANLYAPGRDPIELSCQSADRFVEILVPYLKEWGIVTLQANDGSSGEPAPSEPFPAKLPQEKPE